MQAGSSGFDTRTKLLAAAEAIIVERGITDVSVRKVGDRAELNPTLVTYHFKSIGNLLDELCQLNLQPILDGWQAVSPGVPFEDNLRAWLAPLMSPAAFTPDGRALVVLDEIATHGEGELRENVLRRMEQFSVALRDAITEHCPALSDEELRARLRLISGGVLGPPPRSHGAPIGAEGGKSLDDIEYLVRFAKAALTG